MKTKIHNKLFPALLIIGFFFTAHSVGAAVLTNPLGTTDVRIVVSRLISALLGITGSLALLMFVWGGLQWMTSAGAPDKVKKGKDTLVWATIGLVVIMMAYALVKAVVGALESGTVT